MYIKWAKPVQFKLSAIREYSEASLHVLRCVGEGRAVLRGGVLWTVRRNMAQDHHDGTVRVHPLRHAEVVDAVVGNDVCQVVLWSERILSIRHSVSDRGSERADVRAFRTMLGQCPLWTWCESKKIPKHYFITTVSK